MSNTPRLDALFRRCKHLPAAESLRLATQEIEFLETRMADQERERIRRNINAAFSKAPTIPPGYVEVNALGDKLGSTRCLRIDRIVIFQPIGDNHTKIRYVNADGAEWEVDTVESYAEVKQRIADSLLSQRLYGQA